MKDELRKQIRLQKKQRSKEQIVEDSTKIRNTFLQDKSYLRCNTLFCYVSYNQEVRTKEVILHTLLLGKKVAVPKVIGDKIEFFYIRSLEDLELGYQRILEPVTKEKAIVTEAVMIMPGLAFDLERNRLGYGGGFYDNYLDTHKEVIYHKIAFAFDFQVVKKIEIDNWDIKVDRIITPNFSI